MLKIRTYSCSKLMWSFVLGTLTCLALGAGAAQAQEAFEAEELTEPVAAALEPAGETEPEAAVYSEPEAIVADAAAYVQPVEVLAEAEPAYETEAAIAPSEEAGEPFEAAEAAVAEPSFDEGAAEEADASLDEASFDQGASDENPSDEAALDDSAAANDEATDTVSAEPSDVDEAAAETADEPEASDAAEDAAADAKDVAASEVADADASEAADEGVEAQANTAAKLSGWQVAEGKRYYYGADGKPLTGWQDIDGEKYYFDSDGAARTGYYCDGSTMYFFDSLSGFMLKGEHFVYDAMRNFEDSGAMSTGLTSLPSGQTALYSTYDGSITCGEQYAGGSWHYFDDTTGYMLTRWQEAQRVVAQAWACVGQSEEQAWSYLWEVMAEGGAYCEYGPCVSTVRHFFKMAGMEHFLCDNLISGWPHDFFDYAKAHGQASSTPHVGDVVMFNWSGSFGEYYGLSASHAELVVEVGDGYIRSIGAIYTGIQVRTYWFGSISGYVLPAYNR